MPASYEIHVMEAGRDNRLDVVDDFEYLKYVKRINDVGAFTLILDPERFDVTFAQLDGRMVVWRKPVDGTRTIDFAGFIRKVTREYVNERNQIVISGAGYNYLLKGRTIAYNATTDEARKADQADDMMKEVVDENLGASAATGRDVTGVGFSIQPDVSAGTIVQQEFALKNMLDALKEISDASRDTPSTQAWFGMVPLNSGWEMEFRTNVPQWGQDHSYPAGAHGPVVFALEYGNMQNPRLTWDRFDEATVVYGGGQGEEEARPLINVADTIRETESPLNRREAFHNGSGTNITLELIDAANARLDEGRIKRSFTFDVVEVPSTIYGLHWGFGDVVTANYAAEQHDLHVAVIEVEINRKVETVVARFEEFAA